MYICQSFPPDNLVIDCALAIHDQNILAITTEEPLAKEAVYYPHCYKKNTAAIRQRPWK